MTYCPCSRAGLQSSPQALALSALRIIVRERTLPQKQGTTPQIDICILLCLRPG